MRNNGYIFGTLDYAIFDSQIRRFFGREIVFDR